ncbi:MAG: COG1361 S-layer family protein [Candidatus Micrarchaeia archaeon]
MNNSINKKFNKIRTNILLAIFALLLITTYSNAQLASPNGALSIINLNTSPTTITAGENVILTFQLYNSYSQALQEVNLQLEASNPIIKVSPAYNFLIDTIGSGEYGGMGYDFFTYVLHIPSTLQSGEYVIDVVANYEAPTSTSAQNSQTVPAESIIPIDLYIYGNPHLSMNIMPQGALKPGLQTNIDVDLTNTGTAPIYNITVNLKNSKYFEILGAQRFSIGMLQAGQSIELPTSIMPVLNIMNGTYSLYAYSNYTTEQGNSTNAILESPISIIINKPNIVVSTAGGMPPNLYPGTNQTLNLLIQNIGTGDAKNVSIAFSSSNNINLGSTSKFFIAELPAGGSVSDELFINANKNDYLKLYKIPEQISYFDANYQDKTSINTSFNISVSPGAVLNITNEYSNLSTGGSYEPLTLRIKNIGNEPAQQIALTLQSIYPITPIDSNQYLVSLNPGESANVTFYVSVDTSGNPGQYPISLYAQWSQPNGNTKEEYYSTTNYYAVVEGQPKSPSSASNNNQSIIINIIVLLIIVASAYYIYKKRKTKNRKREKEDDEKSEKKIKK